MRYSVQPWMLATVACAGAGSCECPNHDASERDAGPRWVAPEAWTMGAVADRHRPALPPPCEHRDEPLAAVLARETRFAAEPHTLAHLLVAEGTAMPELKLDASGLVTLRPGSTTVSPMAWPSNAERASVAKADGDRWLVLLPQAGSLEVWRDGHLESTGLGPSPAHLRCGGSTCAIVGIALSSGPALGATMLTGRADERVDRWERTHVEPVPGASFPFALHRVQERKVIMSFTQPTAAGGPTRRAVLLETSADGSTVERQGLELGQDAPSTLLALVDQPVFQALTAPAGSERCDDEHAGVTTVRATPHTPVRLRSSVSGTEGAMNAIGGATLVSWLAPVRCNSRMSVLHAVVLAADGLPVAPVTTVADASRYAVAVRGDDVDMWLGDGERVTWMRIRCSLPR